MQSRTNTERMTEQGRTLAEHTDLTNIFLFRFKRARLKQPHTKEKKMDSREVLFSSERKAQGGKHREQRKPWEPIDFGTYLGGPMINVYCRAGVTWNFGITE